MLAPIGKIQPGHDAALLGIKTVLEGPDFTAHDPIAVPQADRGDLVDAEFSRGPDCSGVSV